MAMVVKKSSFTDSPGWPIMQRYRWPLLRVGTMPGLRQTPTIVRIDRCITEYFGRWEITLCYVAWQRPGWAC